MKKMFRTLLLVIGAFAILGIAPGCKSKAKDSDIQTSVQTALNADTRTSGLTVDVKDGVATISGQVADDAAKTVASTTAGGVKGVKSVTNNVTVAPPVVITADDPLTTGVRDATKDFPGATATVNDGVITVTGELSADQWKRLKMSLDGLNPKRVDAKGLKIK